MCKGQNDKEESITINELLSAISESEYPEYILEAISRIQEWMGEMIEKSDDDNDDIFSEIFGENFEDDPRGIDTLLNALKISENTPMSCLTRNHQKVKPMPSS